MSGKLSAGQRAIVHRKSKPKEMGPEDEGGELNIVPFLDIIVNILMFILATITTVFTATIPVPQPTANNGPSSGAPPQEFSITVKITSDGYIVGATGGWLQQGCRTLGNAVVTVPKRGSRPNGTVDYDTQGLTACMVAIRTNPEWRTQVAPLRKINIAVNGDVPYSALIDTLDAVRGTRAGLSDLFPEPTLGILN